jgi:hypothetical protein
MDRLASKLSTLTLILMAIAGVIMYANAVPNDLTSSDIEAIQKITKDFLPTVGTRTFEQEIKLIKDVQAVVLRVAITSKGIPEGQPREPADLLQAHAGLCYDRSRSIEKTLKYFGFQVRHVAIFKENSKWPKYINTFSGHSWSHAMTEALTRRGWLLIDSNVSWISLDSKGEPMSVRHIQNHRDEAKASTNGIAPNALLNGPFLYIYGLHSRHGRFYPPYNAIPDINYPELYQYITEPLIRQTPP